MPYNNVKVKPRQTVAQPNTQVETLGITTNVPMGDWNAATPYMKLNMVRSHNATYQARKNNQGVEPTITNGWQEVWQVVAYDGRGVSSSTVSYQVGISNNTVPTGEWSETIPDVPQGQYLWTRTTYNFTDGTQTVSYSISLQSLGFTQEDRDSIERITEAIPSSASKNNPLTTTDFVNSSINNFAAFYITSNAQGDAFPTRASLLSTTTFYSGGAVRVPTQNDYAIVRADESQPKGVDGNYPTTRYSYQGGTYPNGQWDFQYVVNNTSLTQAQVNAINSGITKELVAQIGKGDAVLLPLRYCSTAVNLNIRETPDTTSPIITQIPPSVGVISEDLKNGYLGSGDNLVVINGLTDNGWYEVTYQGQTGYMMAECVIIGDIVDLGNIKNSATQPFVICSTSGTSSAKSVQLDGFTLLLGARITIIFTNPNTVTSPTLNVNGTGAKTIVADNDIVYVRWLAGSVMEFVYDGTSWVVLSGYALKGMRVGTILHLHTATSPATFYGGSWTKVKGRFILPYDPSSTNPLYKGTYSSITQYYVNDIVTRNGLFWVCIQDVKGITPNSTNSAYWAEYTAGYQGGETAHSHEAEDMYAQMVIRTTGATEILYKGVPVYTPTYSNGNVSTGTSATAGSTTEGVNVAGSTTSANTMPPYQVEYVWLRTA